MGLVGRKICSQLDPKEVGIDKNFWKTFKPLFTDKTSGQNKIALVENENIANDDKMIYEIFNSYFVNITNTLPITAPPESDVEITSTTDHVLHSNKKYRNHPSIVRIKENVGVVDKFEFNLVAPTDVWNEINQLNSSKKSSGEIPTDILQLLSGLCIDQITFYISKMFECSEFPEKLKLADVSPIFKADDSTLKFNFRPISVLPALSKVMERIMAKQMTPFANTRLSSLLCGFRDGYSTQHVNFATITNSLGIQETGKNTVSTHDVNDPVEIAITKYSSHSSIKKIRENFHPTETFEFRPCSLEEIMTQIERLDHKKACPIESIPAKVLKENSDLFLPYLSSTYNTCILENFFPTELKSGDISSLYKKDDVFNKKNYRPITVLSSVSKIFERLMYEQIIPFAECFLSPLLCGFRKGYNAQHALLKFSETCKAAIDKGGFAGALLMDLSKAFDSLNHELLLAKMYAYGFSRSALTLIHSYLSNRKQRVKINGSYSTWRETNLGVPQGSVLGPLLFNIYITDLFHLMNGTEICNYADDTTLYSCDREVKNVITKLEQNANHLITWFPENHMKLNEDKCHLIIFGTREEKVSMHVGEVQMEESDDEKLLGITLDKKLTFKKHVQAICKKASQKLHALTRISIYMEPKKLKVLMKAFVMSQFSYCSLIWMFHDRTLNNKINRIHERALRIAYKDNVSSFENLLLMDNSVTVHQRNLQLLMIEIYKTRNNLNPSFMKQIFEAKVLPYNLRCSEKLQLPKAKTTGLGIDTVRFVGGRVWETLPTELKTSSSLKIFKRHIKSHKCDACNCRLCKKFYPNLGFLS